MALLLLQGSQTWQLEEDFAGGLTRTQRGERDSPGFCADGWYTFGEFCYKIGTYTATWDDAYRACVSMNSNLVSVRSQDEQDFLILLMYEIRSKVWIGLRRSSIRSQVFEWKDSSPLNYTNWFEGEPNNYRNREGCAHMFYDDCEVGDWNDAPCGAPFKFICKKIKDPTLTEPGRDPGLCTVKNGWLKMRDSCYKFFSTTASFTSWPQAQSLCKSFGGNLAYVKNPAINMLLQINSKGLKGPFWIGIKNTRKHKYTWLGENHPLMYSNWQTDQPKEKSDQQNCVALDGEGKWITGNCGESHPFVCEIGPEPPRPPTLASYGNMTCSYTSQKWHDVGGKYCYIIELTAKVKWREALCRCKEEGGSLGSIHSIEEQNIILHYIKHHDMPKVPVFIGLVRDERGTFGWIDRSAYDYTNWNNGQPNDHAEQCAEMDTRTGKWNDLHCHSAYGYVCSTPKVPIRQNFPVPESKTAKLKGKGGAQHNKDSIVGIAITGLLSIAAALLVFVYFFGNSLKMKLLEIFLLTRTQEETIPKFHVRS